MDAGPPRGRGTPGIFLRPIRTRCTFAAALAIPLHPRSAVLHPAQSFAPADPSSDSDAAAPSQLRFAPGASPGLRGQSRRPGGEKRRVPARGRVIRRLSLVLSRHRLARAGSPCPVPQSKAPYRQPSSRGPCRPLQSNARSPSHPARAGRMWARPAPRACTCVPRLIPCTRFLVGFSCRLLLPVSPAFTPSAVFPAVGKSSAPG